MHKKLYTVFLPSAGTIAFLAILFFIVWQGGSTTPLHEIYISSLSPEQGDTILIRANTKYPAVTGSFEGKNIVFFKNRQSSDWSALLGIDADITPGQYKVLVDASGEKIEKEIAVKQKDFPVIKMPITQELKNKGYTGAKVVQNIKNKDNPVLEEALSKFTPEQYFDSPFTDPLVKMQATGLVFGHLIKGSGYQIQHLGTDLRASVGTKVYAANNGKVALAKELLNYGRTVVIDHGLGIFSLYLHLEEFKVSEGDFVKKDQVIGLSGNTGYSTAPHLHFSIRDNGTRVDPVVFIKESQGTSESFSLASLIDAFKKTFDIGK